MAGGRDQGRRRARRPLPPGRPAERERTRAVLAGPRPDPRAARRAARDRRRRRAGRPAARGGAPVGHGARRAVPARARRGAHRGLLLRRQRVGLGHLARHHAGHQRPARRRARPPGSSARSPTRSRRRTRKRGPARAAGARRTCWSTTPARSGSSGSASTPRCTVCRRASCAPTSATSPGLLHAALTGKWAGDSTSDVPRAPRDHGRVLRPRQIRAGVPRPLDDLCDELLNPKGSRVRDVRDIASARGICVFLERLRRRRPPVWPRRSRAATPTSTRR